MLLHHSALCCKRLLLLLVVVDVVDVAAAAVAADYEQINGAQARPDDEVESAGLHCGARRQNYHH
jgi:hypothetical protein